MAEARFWVGVHAVIANRGRMLVLKRAPTMSYRPNAWDLPGGHLSVGESLEEALIREVREETDLMIAVERLLGANKMPDAPYLQLIYACRPLVYRRLVLQPNEHAEARWVTLGEAAELELIPYLDAILKSGMLRFIDTGSRKP